MRETLSIHIGQAGCQIGDNVWDLLGEEHSLTKDGYLKNSETNINNEVVYRETEKGKFVPRAVFCDLEPSVLDQIRHNNPELYHPSCILTGKEDAANNYARGHYTVGKELIFPALNIVRKMTEFCDGLQGFLVFHSFGGRHWIWIRPKTHLRSNVKPEVKQRF